DDERIHAIDNEIDSYLYAVSVSGVTGVRTHFNESTLSFIRRLKESCKHPVFVGFGISNETQVQLLTKAGADGFIVGSFFAQLEEKAVETGEPLTNILAKEVKQFLKEY
ncbi:tryptophan synthase subunit alpha, partial [bacterium]|nr:tryptophan synthase subunit alpha [bacterium]